jgi:rhodanese-related sulfurtransferase/DNA-binding transcriptional ArsR family regulator
MSESNRNPARANKERLYRLFASLAAAMANPHRLELLDLLTQGPRTVENLALEAHLSVANASQHLQRLKRARLVADQREGLYIRYRLADPAIARLWLDLRGVAAQQLADVQSAQKAYRPQQYAFPRITPDGLLAGQRRGKLALLDVRPRVEYEAGHLPEAISIPLGELRQRIKELPKSKTIVAYCRGPYCVFADQALDLLSRWGWKVMRLEEGVAEWQQSGLAVEP